MSTPIPVPASLPALATVEDITDRMPRALTSEEEARSAFLLKDASSRIRAFTRQKFSKIQTAEVMAPEDNQIILPQRPVVSVDGVARVNADGRSYLPFGVWTWDGIATIMLGPPAAVINAPEVWTDTDWFWRNVTYLITYTHGFETVPDEIVGICAGMVQRTLLSPGAPGQISGTVGSYSYRMADGFPAAQVSLSADDEAMLLPYRSRRNRTIELG